MKANKVSSDIALLGYALEQGYVGSLYAPRDSFLRSMESLRSISGEMSASDLRDRIDEALLLIPDNHLKARIEKHPSRQRINRMKRGEVGENGLGPGPATWAVRSEKIGKKLGAYIAIRNFPSSLSQKWQGFLAAAEKSLLRAQWMILDLRGNSGGDDSIAIDLAQLLHGGSFQHPIDFQKLLQTPVSEALQLNAIIAEDPTDVSAIREARHQFEMASNGEIPAEILKTGKGSSSSAARTKKAFDKPILVLIDSECSSSCEFLALSLEGLKDSQRVGENTSGTVHFSNAGLLTLPESQVEVLIPSQFNHIHDGRFIENMGLSPDQKVEPGQDALSVARSLLLKDSAKPNKAPSRK